MKRLYFFFRRISAPKLTMLFLALGLIPGVLAQEVTFYEDFDDIALGALPEGWTIYSDGGADPTANWKVSTYGDWGSNVAFSAIEGAKEGEIDQDWLITPQVTPASDDYLIFESAQTYNWFEYGTLYHVLVSTTTADPSSFTDTLGTYNETTFPGYMEKLTYDLSAYVGTPVYIAFVHETSSTDPYQTDDWYLDNVWVRPLQAAAFHSATTYAKGSTLVPIGKSRSTILYGAKLTIRGDSGTVKVNAFTFSSEGTSEVLDITKATLYATGEVTFISSSQEPDTVWAEAYGTASDPGSTFEIAGDMDLAPGDYYFWLTYTIDPSLTPEYPFPQANANISKVTIEGTEYDATPTETEKTYPVVPTRPANEKHENAVEITVGGKYGTYSSTYGSYNLRAISEPEKEYLAYCAPAEGVEGTVTLDVGNSVWWSFTAPSDGTITADLTGSAFNTILVFQDEEAEQLACNDDIDTENGHYQSRIEDFEVSEGQKIYIRVTGVGYPGDPNGEAGVVILNFSFESLISGAENPEVPVISSPYPNPASDMAAIDLNLAQTKHVKVALINMLGQQVLNLYEGSVTGREKRTIRFDTSCLPAGAYLVQVQSSEGIESTDRLIIAR